MPTPIELTLSSLLPTVSYLPPELISLCTSLLAQSRAKASSLMIEEEIGRTYACCHIACQRLGHRLALEIAKPNPPVKPKVYAKLHKYLNAVLKTTAAPSPRTPGEKVVRDRESGGRSMRESKSAQATPSKKVTAIAATTPVSKKRTASQAHEEGSIVPDFAKPIIRLVCKSSDSPEAIPHVFAGLSSILTYLDYPSTATRPAKRMKRTSKTDPVPAFLSESQMPNMIMALFVVIYGRMHGDQPEIGKQDIDDHDIQIPACKAWRQYESGTQLDEWDYEDEMDTREEISQFKIAIRGDWSNMEYYRNIPIGELSTEAIAGAEGAEDGAEVDADDVRQARRPAKTPLRRNEKHAKGRIENDDMGAAGLLPGLGTMFQPAIDWLSDERREDFAAWKSEVLRQISAAA